VESKVDRSQPLNLIDDSSENDITLDALDAPHYQQVTHHWIVMRQANTWRPPTDVFELDDRLVVVVEIAGMRDGEFNVVLQDRRLLITGVRRRVARERIAFHQMEVRYGEFRTSISLPWPVDRDRVLATYKDGFLRVELPRSLSQQVHIVTVDIEQDAVNREGSDE
jgi:HSP20 family protein